MPDAVQRGEPKHVPDSQLRGRTACCLEYRTGSPGATELVSIGRNMLLGNNANLRTALTTVEEAIFLTWHVDPLRTVRKFMLFFVT